MYVGFTAVPFNSTESSAGLASGAGVAGTSPGLGLGRVCPYPVRYNTTVSPGLAGLAAFARA